MPENFSIDNPSTQPQNPPETGLDGDASELIDHLFAQLEQQLQADSSSNRKAPLSSNVNSTQALGSALTGPTELEVSYRPIDVAIEPLRRPDPWETALDEAISASEPQEPKWGHRLFFGLAFTSIAGALLWAGSQLNRQPATVLATTPVQETVKGSLAQQQFAAKITKSLKQKNKPTAPAPVPPSSATPLAPLKPAAISAVPNASPGATPTQGLSTLKAAQTAAPPLPAAKRVTTIPANVVPARIPAKTTESLPKVLPVQPVTKAPAPPTNELPQVKPEQPAAPPLVAARAAKPAPLTTVSKESQTLVGVLELGDQSAALVSNNGATRQVKIGEILNESGWILIAIENGQAIIKRGGQVRALDPKQKF